MSFIRCFYFLRSIKLFLGRFLHLFSAFVRALVWVVLRVCSRSVISVVPPEFPNFCNKQTVSNVDVATSTYSYGGSRVSFYLCQISFTKRSNECFLIVETTVGLCRGHPMSERNGILTFLLAFWIGSFDPEFTPFTVSNCGPSIFCNLSSSHVGVLTSLLHKNKLLSPVMAVDQFDADVVIYLRFVSLAVTGWSSSHGSDFPMFFPEIRFWTE